MAKSKNGSFYPARLYPSISYAASFMLSFNQVSAKAKKYGFSSLHISLKNFSLSISLINIPFFPDSLLVSKFWIFATWNFGEVLIWKLGGWGGSWVLLGSTTQQVPNCLIPSGWPLLLFSIISPPWVSANLGEKTHYPYSSLRFYNDYRSYLAGHSSGNCMYGSSRFHICNCRCHLKIGCFYWWTCFTAMTRYGHRYMYM